ncbi:DUF3343 domain-containing protein [Anoxynatronum sibiricum]|uniref:DUF3343 domain-containing protein n=1 Tax=Anoxynatronum sibiricum TaxID=210623 RepID=A0ABU9VS00_9CLOT
MKEYMVLFFTHSGAIKFKRFAKREGFSCELMPVPRQLSSNCGVGAKITYEGPCEELADEEIEKIYLAASDGYHLVFTSDT